MNDRYKEVFRLTPNIYVPGCPVILEVGVIQNDTKLNRTIIQLKFKNISTEKIAACAVSIQAYDIRNSKLGEPFEFQYLDLNAAKNQEFGQKTAIPMPDNTSRKFTIKSIEVIFDNGKNIKVQDCNWKSISDQKKMRDFFKDPELLKQYNIEAGPGAYYVPKKEDGLYYCTCGTINPDTAGVCSECKRRYKDLEKILKADYLKPIAEARIKAEEEERIRAEEEAKRIQAEREAAEAERRKKLKKIGIIGAGAAAVILLVVLIVNVFVPNSKYNKALKLKDSGEYVAAIEGFTNLDGYKDSEDQIKECKELKQEADYNSAISLMSNNDFEKALEAFNALGSYKDSASKIEDCEEGIRQQKYDKANEYFKSANYESAAALFTELNDYKDSKKLCNECSYQIALSKFKQKDYENAKQLFAKLGNYNDSQDKQKECVYQIGKECLNAKKYDEAYKNFASLKDYSDSEDLAKESRYQSAMVLWNAKKYDDSNVIFKELKDYKDSREKIHEHKYATEVTVQPGCTTEGKMKYTCDCGKTYTETMNALGHSYSQIQSAKEATCTENGQIVYVCRCGQTKTETLPATGHTYAQAVTKEVTCTTDGVITYTCHCGSSYTEPIPSTGHVYDEGTCWEPAQCIYCGKTNGKALGHTTKKGTCSRCGMYIRDGEEWESYREWLEYESDYEYDDDDDWW